MFFTPREQVKADFRSLQDFGSLWSVIPTTKFKAAGLLDVSVAFPFCLLYRLLHFYDKCERRGRRPLWKPSGVPDCDLGLTGSDRLEPIELPWPTRVGRAGWRLPKKPKRPR